MSVEQWSGEGRGAVEQGNNIAASTAQRTSTATILGNDQRRQAGGAAGRRAVKHQPGQSTVLRGRHGHVSEKGQGVGKI
jgi:hypothetical protein